MGYQVERESGMERWALRRVNSDGAGVFEWWLMERITTNAGTAWVDKARIGDKDLAYNILGFMNGAEQ